MSVAMPVEEDQVAHEHVREIVKASGTSFFWAMRLLPDKKQAAMYAVYAFCRVVDDIADEPAPQAEKIRGLNNWRHRIEALFLGQGEGALEHCLRSAIQQFSLRKVDFLAILDGMEMDALGPLKAPTEDDLELYCDRVAGAVGLLSVRIFGCNSPLADEFALATGQALQLTNILRDLEEDAADGRLYLPKEYLVEAGIVATSPQESLKHPNIHQVCSKVAEKAKAAFKHAEALRAEMSPADAASLKPALIMTAIYRRIFEKLLERGWETSQARVSLGKGEKLWIALKAAYLTR